MKYYFLFIFFLELGLLKSQPVDDKNYQEVNHYLNDISKKDPVKAIDYINNELSQLSKDNDSLFITLLYFKGNSALLLHDLVLAHESFTKALDVVDKSDYSRRAAIYQGLGVLYDDASKYSMSDSCYNIALSLYKSNSDSSGIIEIYNNIAVVEIDRKNYQEAIRILENAIEYSQSNYHSILILNNIGESYSSLNENKKAKKYYIAAYQLSKKMDSPHINAVMNINLADIYLRLNITDSSSSYIDNALTIIKKYNYVLLKLEALKTQAKILKAQGELDESYNVYQNYVLLNDSINSIEKYNELNKLDEKRLKEKQIAAINLISHDNEKWNLKLYLIITLSIAVIFSIILLLVKQVKQVKRIRKEKKKSKTISIEKKSLIEEMDYKNRELEHFAHHINTKNELLEKLKQNIKYGVNDVKEAKLLINKNLDLEKDKKEFYRKIDQLQDAFFLRLKKKYPNLTEKDLQLSALLIIGMPSKEMSDTLNISLDGVKKARYRVRKKMNLSRKDSLLDVLLNV